MDHAMKNGITRREFVGVTATVVLTGSLVLTGAAAAGGEFKPIKILGIAGSPRPGDDDSESRASGARRG